MFPITKIITVLLLVGLMACSTTNTSGRAINIDEVRPRSTNLNEQKIEIPKKLYLQMLREGGAKNRIRMVEVFTRNSEQGVREYRFFGIQPGSIYQLLGLQNVDVLVAANGFIVPEQDVFWQYLQVLPMQEKAFIEIKRSGQSIVFSYKFKD